MGYEKVKLSPETEDLVNGTPLLLNKTVWEPKNKVVVPAFDHDAAVGEYVSRVCVVPQTCRGKNAKHKNKTAHIFNCEAHTYKSMNARALIADTLGAVTFPLKLCVHTAGERPCNVGVTCIGLHGSDEDLISMLERVHFAWARAMNTSSAGFEGSVILDPQYVDLGTFNVLSRSPAWKGTGDPEKDDLRRRLRNLIHERFFAFYYEANARRGTKRVWVEAPKASVPRPIPRPAQPDPPPRPYEYEPARRPYEHDPPRRPYEPEPPRRPYEHEPSRRPYDPEPPRRPYEPERPYDYEPARRPYEYDTRRRRDEWENEPPRQRARSPSPRRREDSPEPQPTVDPGVPTRDRSRSRSASR